MSSPASTCEHFTVSEIDRIRAVATPRCYPAGKTIFKSGDEADHLYLIESGKVSVFIDKLHTREELSLLGPGQYFGEMAILNNARRSASVITANDTHVLCVTKQTFLSLMETDQAIADKISAILIYRSRELVLKERLLTCTGLNGKALQVSIKGDPSMRESAFVRERHESVADRVLDRLAPQVEELLLRRSVYKVSVHFNSGEVRISNLFDPFNDEIHPVDKFLDEGYIDRHFSRMEFDRKVDIVQRVYHTILEEASFAALPPHLAHLYSELYACWQPLPPADIIRVVSQLPKLRRIPNFYLRNFAVSMTHDAVRMQFNCDGTHIVSAQDYQCFLDENLGDGDTQ